jgi:hypothetical protein
MSDAYLEIVELENGDVALQAGGIESEPLVSIRFSEITKDQLSHKHMNIAKAMLEAGFKALGDMSGASVDVSQMVDEPADRLVH